ncbi:beta-1,4-glucuronyltransferase 1-like isoform X2 [Rhodnius prolixus]|uniref:beta-1,4-glucuronyltransferase 1-like isoform X2 n=1 Tax=Rhodnius prolixus TaxID=13249 RepID=UPI003D18A1BC
MMIAGSCTKLILLLTAVVAILQIIHLVLLNHLDSIKLQNKILVGVKESSVSPEIEGAISVAVYAEEKDVYEALWKIAHLQSCFQVFKENVTFSIVSPVPAKSTTPSSLPTSVEDNICSFFREEHVQNYAFTQRYPNNLLRNVARRASSTEFVIVIDIDMMPSESLRQDFLLFATQKGLFKKNHIYDKTAFVVPAFEAKDNIEPPLHKAQLISLVETGEIRPFYSQICSKCQALTNYEVWLNEPIGAELAPLYDVIWKDPWEPFYIARNNAPLYDERFKQYGFNRISQVCELHVAGYTFSVLNNAFLIHRGFKTSDSFHEDKDKDQNNNRHLFRQFKAELKFKYIDSSRRCY